MPANGGEGAAEGPWANRGVGGSEQGRLEEVGAEWSNWMYILSLKVDKNEFQLEMKQKEYLIHNVN